MRAKKADKKEIFVICDNIRSLENVGSIFRTADALGVSKIYLCGITAVPPNEKIAKTALGAEQTVPFEHHKQTWRLVDTLKKNGIFVVALEQAKNSIDYTKLKPKFPLALIVGHEVKGVSKKITAKVDSVIHLPMHGKKESLNVSVAFGIAGYQMRRYISNK